MYLVFDLGATKTRMALSSDGVKLEQVATFVTDRSAGGQALLINEAKRLAGRHRIAKVAGGVAGSVDRKNGVLLNAPNLPQWGRVDLASMFKQAFKAPLLLENDTALVGLGEAARGSGSVTEIMAYVTISTGVNGVRLVDGRIDRSTYGFEIGHQIISHEGNSVTTLEAAISGHALQERYGRLPSAIDDPIVWQKEIDQLAVALYNLNLFWSPRVIVLGGSMMRDISIPAVLARMHHLPKVFPAWPQLKLAELDDRGGLYGALELIRLAS